MSGKLTSSGLLTNKGLKELNINGYLNSSIKDLSIHVIPLSTDPKFSKLQMIGTYAKMFIPMIINPSLTHVAIQLNLDNSNDVLIIEYGKYLTQDSQDRILQTKKTLSSNSSNSSKLRENENENIYYYINKDGARITIFSYEYLKDIAKSRYERYDENISQLISDLIASQYYELSYEKFREVKYKNWAMGNAFISIDCDIKQKMTVNKLIENFKGEKWEAKNYNGLFHNCQDFAVEIIKILEAVRKNELHKIRMGEKMFLPGCIISALRENEEFSITNTLGRIPIFGFFHDLYCLTNR